MPSRFRNSRSSSASFRSRISRTPPTSLDTIFMTVPLSCVTLPTVLCTGRSRAEPQHLEEEAAEPACRWRRFTGAEVQYLHHSAKFAGAMWLLSHRERPTGGVVTNVPSSMEGESYAAYQTNHSANRSSPETRALRRSWAIASIPGPSRLFIFGSHPRSHYRFDVGQCHQTSAAQTVSGGHGGRGDASARIRLRRVHYSGFGVLSVRPQAFQRFDALRPERRFYPQPDPRIPRPR